MAKVRRNASTPSSGSGSGATAANTAGSHSARAPSPNATTSTSSSSSTPLQDPSSSASPSSTSATDPAALATTLPAAPTPTFEQFSRSLATELSLPDLTSASIPADIRNAISRLQREIFNISMTLSLTRKAGHQLVDVGSKLEASKHDVDRSLAATSHRVTLLDAEAVELRKACKDCRSTLGSMRSELAQARDELKLRRAMEGDLKATKVKFASCMEGMEKECDKLRKECAKLKDQNEQLLSQLKAAKKTLENAEKTLSRQAAQQAQAQAQQQQQVQQGAAQAAGGKPPQAPQQQQAQQQGAKGSGGGNHVAPKLPAQQAQPQPPQQRAQPATKSNVPAPVPAAAAAAATPNGTAHTAAQPARTTANAHGAVPAAAAAVPAPHDANARSAAGTIAQAAADGGAHHGDHGGQSYDEADDDDVSDEEDDGEEDDDEEDEEDQDEDEEGDEDDEGDDEEEDEEEEEEEEQEKSYNDLARDFLRSLELKDYAGFCSNVAHLVTHEHAQQVNDWNALAIGALWLIALAGDCHGHAHVQNVVESLPDVRYQHAWVQLIAQLHEYAMANEPREFYNALEQVVQSHMVKQVAPLRDILNALRILQRIRFLNSFIMSDNRFKRSNQVSLRMALFKTDFRDVVQLRQWLERELEGSDTQLALAGGGKNLADVRTLKNKLHDKLKGAENTYKKALDYLTTSMPPLAPGLTVGK